MNGANGRRPGGPLHLNGAQRQAALAKLGLSDGWLLVSVSEMYEMQKAMDGAAKENERLNKQAVRLIARQIVNASITDKVLQSSKATLAKVAESAADFALRADALAEVANIDEAIAVLPQPLPQQPEEEKKP